MLTPKTSFDFTSASLDARVTFSRLLNTATRANANGYIEQINANLPRFDFDPITLACRGLLIEEARTNSLLNSSLVGAGTPSNSVYTPSVATAPDGTNSFNLWTENSTASVPRVGGFGTYSGPAGVPVTYSIYAKYAGRYLSVYPQGSAGAGYAIFDLLNGTIVKTGGAQYTASKIEPAKNGAYRCQVTVTSGSGGGFNTVVCLSNSTATPNPQYNGDGVSGVYIWGGQFEQGAFATSYIPTTTTALTRNADVATITGANFSDWWQATRGGVLVRARPGTVSGVRPWLQFDDGTVNEIIALRGNTTNPELYIVDGGVAQAQIDAGTLAANTDYSLTGWWATNDCKARLDSGAVVTDTSATIPTVTQARLGSDGTNYLNGHLASISYYDTFSSQIYTRRKNKAIFSLL